MDRKLMCVSNVRYRKPSQREGSRMKNLLKYLIYRESRYETARYVSGKERWNDHGMGASVKEEAEQQAENLRLFLLRERREREQGLQDHDISDGYTSEIDF